MNRPSLFTYAIGNPLSALVLGGASVLLLWRWWHGTVANLAAIIAAVVLWSTLQAVDRLFRYQSWKRQWDAMAGIPPRRSLIGRVARLPGVRWLLLLGIWFAMANYARQHPEDDVIALPVLVGLPALMVLVVLYRLIRWQRRRTARRRVLAPVALVLKRPRGSPTREAATQALPDYCKPLVKSGG
jgi:membrane protein YdbS with pleckstrin-like domain